MNYFKEAENVLHHRRKLQKSLENLNRRQERLLGKGTPAVLTGLDTTKPYVSGGAINDTMQDCLELIEIKRDKKDTEDEIEIIDSVLHQLPREDCELLSLWYIDGLPKDEICSEMHFAIRKSIYDRRNKAVGEFAILYFGVNALKSIV